MPSAYWLIQAARRIQLHSEFKHRSSGRDCGFRRKPRSGRCIRGPQARSSRRIFVPVITPKNKVDRLRQYGAAITITGNSYSEALAASRERAEKTGAVVIHAYDDARVLAGQGTLGMQ